MKSRLNICDEQKLLVDLCRMEFSDGDLLKIEQLIARIKDWDYFRFLVNVHGIAALSFRNLEKHNLILKIPASTAEYLKKTHLINLSRNTFNTKAIGQVLSHLNKAGIKTIILKGLALENTVYGREGLRQMSDIDILIDRKDCMKARKILLGIGYESLPSKSFFHTLILDSIGKHLPALIKNGTSVEIHHGLFGKDSDDLTRLLYDGSYEVELAGERAWFPQPQLFFLYLVRHLWKHELYNESQLRLYADLVVLLEKYQEKILNKKLIELASEAGMSGALALRLQLLREFWGFSFPGWLNEFIDSYAEDKSIEKFVFFLGSPKNNAPLKKHVLYRQIIKDIPGFHRRLLFVLGDILPSVAFMKKRYETRSTLRAIMHYPHRLGKILWLFKN
jgi:hypothetical protein